VGLLLEHADDLGAFVLGTAGRREGDDVAHHLGGVRGVVDERLGANRDLVAEHGGDLVGVAGAAEVPKQRDPVGGLPHLGVDSRRLAHPRREQARAQLRLERLAEGVVLCKREGGDKLTEAKRYLGNGVSSRCIGLHRQGQCLHDASCCRSGRLTSLFEEDT
jgi:hypothetical protein